MRGERREPRASMPEAPIHSAESHSPPNASSEEEGVCVVYSAASCSAATAATGRALVKRRTPSSSRGFLLRGSTRSKSGVVLIKPPRHFGRILGLDGEAALDVAASERSSGVSSPRLWSGAR